MGNRENSMALNYLSMGIICWFKVFVPAEDKGLLSQNISGHRKAWVFQPYFCIANAYAIAQCERNLRP